MNKELLQIGNDLYDLSECFGIHNICWELCNYKAELSIFKETLKNNISIIKKKRKLIYKVEHDFEYDKLIQKSILNNVDKILNILEQKLNERE